jgi:hypothetical protein
MFGSSEKEGKPVPVVRGWIVDRVVQGVWRISARITPGWHAPTSCLNISGFEDR